MPHHHVSDERLWGADAVELIAEIEAKLPPENKRLVRELAGAIDDHVAGSVLDCERATFDHFLRHCGALAPVVRAIWEGIYDPDPCPACPPQAHAVVDQRTAFPPPSPCQHCKAPLAPEVAAAASAASADCPPFFPDGRRRPDVLGLVVNLAGMLENAEPGQDEAEMFAVAFARWTGAPPEAFVDLTRHMVQDCEAMQG